MTGEDVAIHRRIPLTISSTACSRGKASRHQRVQLVLVRAADGGLVGDRGFGREHLKPTVARCTKSGMLAVELGFNKTVGDAAKERTNEAISAIFETFRYLPPWHRGCVHRQL